MHYIIALKTQKLYFLAAVKALTHQKWKQISVHWKSNSDIFL